MKPFVVFGRYLPKECDCLLYVAIDGMPSAMGNAAELQRLVLKELPEIFLERSRQLELTSHEDIDVFVHRDMVRTDVRGVVAVSIEGLDPADGTRWQLMHDVAVCMVKFFKANSEQCDYIHMLRVRCPGDEPVVWKRATDDYITR